MTKQIVFMTEQEITESVEKITGGTDILLTFNETIEMDMIELSLPLKNTETDDLIASIKTIGNVAHDGQTISFPVASIIPAISNLIQIPLKNTFDICECNLYEGETLYTFFVA